MKNIRLYIGSYAKEEDPGKYLYDYDISTEGFSIIQELEGCENLNIPST